MMSNNTDHSVLSNMDQATLLAALSQQRQSSSKTKAKLVSFDEITKASDAAASVESAIIVCPNCQCKILRPRVGTYMVYQVCSSCHRQTWNPLRHSRQIDIGITYYPTCSTIGSIHFESIRINWCLGRL